MTASPSPDKGMLMSIPVGGGRLNCLHDLLPRLKAPTFERQRTQNLPPRFDQVQIGGALGLIDELPAWMMDHEEQQVAAMMHLQIVHDGVDALSLSRDLLVHIAEEVDKVHLAAAGMTLRPAVPGGLSQCSIDIALGPAPVINLLLGPLGWTHLDIDRFLTSIALSRHRFHLIDV